MNMEIVEGDITGLALDAIVKFNGAIHRAAGPDLLVEC